MAKNPIIVGSVGRPGKNSPAPSPIHEAVSARSTSAMPPRGQGRTRHIDHTAASARAGIRSCLVSKPLPGSPKMMSRQCTSEIAI